MNPFNSIVQGRNYRFYIWVKAVAASTSTESALFAIKLAYFNNASEVKGLAIPVVAATTADGWSKYAIVGQAPQGAQRMRLKIIIESKSHTLFCR